MLAICQRCQLERELTHIITSEVISLMVCRFCAEEAGQYDSLTVNKLPAEKKLQNTT